MKPVVTREKVQGTVGVLDIEEVTTEVDIRAVLQDAGPE